MAGATGTGYPASDVLGQITNGVPDFTTDTSRTTADGLSYPDGTALDTVHHRLFVADEDNYRVLVYDLDSNNNIISHSATYALGQADLISGSYSGSTNQSSFNDPYAALAYDSQNNRLFVSDSQNHRVLVYDFANGISDNMLASNVIGEPDFFTSNGVVSRTGMEYPEGLAFDTTNQRLFVSDYDAGRVTVYNVAPGSISNGEPASNVIGQNDYTSSNQVTTQNGLSEPEAIAYNDVTHQLFVGDSHNYRVMVFDLTNGITDGMNASYVLGENDFMTANNGAATQSSFGDYVEGMGIDTTRNILYVQDDNFNRILVFNLSNGISNNMNASMVLGQVDFTSSDYSCISSATTLCDSEGNITVDSANDRIYVPDADSDRVLIYNFDHFTTPTGSLGGGVVGSAYNQTLQTTGSECTQSFSINSGSLPPGLSLNSTTGQISGSPTKSGTYTFDLTVSDNCGAIGLTSDDPVYTITISPAASTLVAPNTGYGKSSNDTTQKIITISGLLLLTLGIRIRRKQNRLG